MLYTMQLVRLERTSRTSTLATSSPASPVPEVRSGRVRRAARRRDSAHAKKATTWTGLRRGNFSIALINLRRIACYEIHQVPTDPLRSAHPAAERLLRAQRVRHRIQVGLRNHVS